MRLLPIVICAAGLAGCGDRASAPPGREITYRPALSGTVDHALCLLGFQAPPLRDIASGHQLVEGALNGRPANFILDTGANVSVVSAAHADHFGLTPQRGVFAAAAGLGGALQASRSRIETLRLGDVEVRLSHLMVADLSQMDRALGLVARRPVHGIIGQDVMRTHAAVVDIARPMLYLQPAGARPSPKPAEACREVKGAPED